MMKSNLSKRMDFIAEFHYCFLVWDSNTTIIKYKISQTNSKGGFHNQNSFHLWILKRQIDAPVTSKVGTFVNIKELFKIIDEHRNINSIEADMSESRVM